MKPREVRLKSVGVLVAMFAIPGFQSGAQLPASHSPETNTDTYAYDNRTLTAEQQLGRDTWYFWTAGDQKFWRRMAAITGGDVDLLMYVDSRNHDSRFERLGVINHPKCKAALEPDRYGLWMDDCSEAEQVPQIPGTPAGIVGLRRFDNPAFDAVEWSLQAYRNDRASIEPPYLVGMSCGFCHVGFSPIKPAGRPEQGDVGESVADDRQSVFRRRQAVQPQHEAVRFPVARGEPAAARDVRHVAICHRSHQQPKRHQHDLQPVVQAGRGGEDAGWIDPPGQPHPERRGRFGRHQRRVAPRLREHRHVRRLLGHAARSHLRREDAAAAVRHGTRAGGLRRLANDRGADAGRRSVSEDADAAASRRGAGRLRPT